MEYKFNDLIDSAKETKTLNIDKIKDLEDVKRILKFLDIKVTVSETIEPNGFSDVKDLFEL